MSTVNRIFRQHRPGGGGDLLRAEIFTRDPIYELKTKKSDFTEFQKNPDFLVD